MSTVSVSNLEVIEPTSVVVATTLHEETVPLWRQRLRWWVSFIARPSSMIRLVGPNERPLERHQFETNNYDQLRNRVL